MIRRKRISRRGVRFIADFEGFRSHPYLDAVGVWTIGYGHTRNVGPRTRAWSKRKARRVLRREINRDYAPTVAALGLPLTRPMFDALTSFIYNLGPGALGPDTGIGHALRHRHWHVAADEILEWDKAGGRSLPGLTRRRRAERRTFLSRLPRRQR